MAVEVILYRDAILSTYIAVWSKLRNARHANVGNDLGKIVQAHGSESAAINAGICTRRGNQKPLRECLTIANSWKRIAMN